jgi:hypothetical protein
MAIEEGADIENNNDQSSNSQSQNTNESSESSSSSNMISSSTSSMGGIEITTGLSILSQQDKELMQQAEDDFIKKKFTC